jgi:hypothetical protein
MLLACVLECSSIGAMVLLTAIVVITRIGVNKEFPVKPVEDPSPSSSDSVADAAPRDGTPPPLH